MDADAALIAQMTERLRPLRVVVDAAGRVRRIDGDAAHYGYAELRTGEPVEDQLPLLTGMTELESFAVDALETPSGCSADVRWVRDAEGAVLTLFDASQARGDLQASQQAANESQILQYRLKQATEQLRKKQQELIHLAYHDALTGLYNRRQFVERLPEEIGRARRDDSPLSLLLIDIDHFKAYNDRYGHLAGDRCLHRVAALIGACARRPADVAARVGGEEFAVLLPDTLVTSALELADQLRGRIEAAAIENAPSAHRVITVSIGVAQLRPATGDPSWEQLYRDADAALYAAKAGGRNTVACHPDSGG